MSQVTNDEIEDDTLNDQTGSRLNDEGNGGSVGGVALKKGPWTSAEDAILVDYIRKNGEGNWNAVQKNSGLSRCGKSCRLRWANHLRPNLKKGAFTAEEEQLVAELHAKMGNKWARMAAHLPGRTDNEIKNYWNTRIKRRQRSRLPLYPLEVCLRALKESQCDQGTGGVNDGDREHHDFLPKNNYEMHHAIFDNLKKNQGILPTAPEHPNISANRIMLNSIALPPYCNFKPSTLPDHNHFQESTLSFLSSSGTNGNWFYPFGHVQDHTSDKIAHSFGLHSPLDPGPSSHNSINYRHSLSNGNSITSKPTLKAVKLELPSLQNPETEYGSWCTFPPPPMDVSVFIQPPLPHGAPETVCSLPQNSGLLDAVLYQAKTRTCSKNNFSDKSSNSSAATPVERAESSEPEDYTEPAYPFGATSILNECHAVGSSTTGNSWDKWKPAQNFRGNNVNYETVDQVCTPNSENQTVSLLNFTWPDILLASEWLEQCHGHDKDQTCMTEASDDLTDYKNVARGT